MTLPPESKLYEIGARAKAANLAVDRAYAELSGAKDIYASARSDIPALLAAVRALREGLESVLEEVGLCRNTEAERGRCCHDYGLTMRLPCPMAEARKILEGKA